ncbi:MAG TPA: glycosyltransferase family 1 protein, partial [Actinomycetales bacterium]|nr:glycosyltransferase family 1 protein [Actinomycetales bacterium]
MSKIVVATLDTLTTRMAGPAIRAWEISRLLGSLGHDVRLLTFASCERLGDGFVATTTSVDGFRDEVESSEIVIIQGYIAATFPWLAEVDQYVVFDLYDPFHLESLAVERHKPMGERTASLGRALRELEVETRC